VQKLTLRLKTTAASILAIKIFPLRSLLYQTLGVPIGLSADCYLNRADVILEENNTSESQVDKSLEFPDIFRVDSPVPFLRNFRYRV
jgi:hypothetical protein